MCIHIYEPSRQRLLLNSGGAVEIPRLTPAQGHPSDDLAELIRDYAIRLHLIDPEDQVGVFG